MADHPIFTESLRRIRELLALRTAADPALAAWLAGLGPLERDVLERCIHSSGDVAIASDLRFAPAAGAAGIDPDGRRGCPPGAPGGLPPGSGADGGSTPAAPDRGSGACAQGLAALQAGASILTDTAMAAAAVAPMARRTGGNRVLCLLDWAPPQAPVGSTRAAAGMAAAWRALAGSDPAPLLLIGSAPTALEVLLDLVEAGAPPPALVVGMPVGFVGVAESKRRLAQSGLSHIRLEGSRGGAALVAAACNALLRWGWLTAEVPPHPR